MLDCVIFLMRQSPDWEALAADYRRGIPIDPARYLPGEAIPSFPAKIAESVERWNRICPVNFFECRVVLKGLAMELLGSARNAVLLGEADIPTLARRFDGANYLLFCFDDDDWYSPDSFDLLASLDYAAAAVAVFPLVRFGRPSFTFVRETETARVVVGARGPFPGRYQTNNYGLRPPLCQPEDLARMRDHFTASHHADAMGLTDRYFDVLLCATNKTPCSASVLVGIVDYRRDFFRYVASYVEHLRAVVLPDECRWAEAPLRRTRELFESMLPDRARTVHWLPRPR